MQMVRCVTKSPTGSPLTLSETVEFSRGFPAIADVAEAVQAARVRTTPAEPSMSESELHSATHIPF